MPDDETGRFYVGVFCGCRHIECGAAASQAAVTDESPVVADRSWPRCAPRRHA